MDDLISRQAAIDIVNRYNKSHMILKGKPMLGAASIVIELEELPPAQPEPHEGHWIKHIDPFDGEQYECSECGVLWEFNDGTPEDNEAYFCPNCGAKMTNK